MGYISAFHLSPFHSDDWGKYVLDGPANNSDFNSDEIPCKALERVNSDVPNIIGIVYLFDVKVVVIDFDYMVV